MIGGNMQPVRIPRMMLYFGISLSSGRDVTEEDAAEHNRKSTIIVLELMRKIEKQEKQSNLHNKVKLMDSKQERDKQVRTFVARLRGLANICILFTDCTSKTCNKTVSHMDTPILHALVKGLVELDTNGGFG
jgi:hypothetical protein